MPGAALTIWATSTLFWWAFAFMPLPSEPPPWLAAARYACFGVADSGLPGLEGWILLVVAPVTLLIALVVLWGAELPAVLRRAVRSPAGITVVLVLGSTALVEAGWVWTKVDAARRTADWQSALVAQETELPADYPRRMAAAPDFTLVDQHGAAVSLASFRGRPVVVTFIFAHCQTMCPLLVTTIKRALPGAPAAEVLLVTLDPWRDTVSSLPGLAERWEIPGNFHVLSAPRVDDVLRAVQAYEVPFQRNEQTGDIVHPGLVFLIDPQGRLAYTFNNPPAAWVRQGLDRLAGTGGRVA